MLFVVAVLLHLAGAPLAAPSPDEQRLFAEGLRAFEAGDARAAEKAWKAGYAVGHDPAFLVRIGEAEEKAGAPAEAAATYRRYLHEVPDASDRADIEQRLARLPPPPEAPAPAPAETPGELGASAANTGVHTVPPPRAPSAVPPGADEQPAAPAQEDLGWNATRITAWVATGVAILGLGTAAFFAASAGSHSDDVNLLVSYRDPVTGAPLQYSMVAQRYQAAVDQGHSDDRNAKIALGVAAGAAAVAATAFILDAVRTPEARLSLAPAATGRGATGALTWTF